MSEYDNRNAPDGFENIDMSKEYLTTTEFGKIVCMSPDTLQYYHRIGVFTASKTVGKYHYYSPTQITTIKMISVLTGIGVKLETIKELATERKPEDLMKLLYKHKTGISDILRFYQEAYSIISVFLDLMTEGMYATENEIHVREVPELPITFGEPNNFNGADRFYKEYIRFCNSQCQPMSLAFPVGGYFGSINEFIKSPSKPSRFFSINPSGTSSKEAGIYLIGYTRGYYGKVGNLVERMTKFATMNKLVFNGPVFQIYLHDEMCITDPDNYLLQVSAAVNETKRAHTWFHIH